MNKLLPYLAIAFLILGCSPRDMRYSAGATYTDEKYTLLILSYSDEKDALGVAVLDREGDGIEYEPRPDEKHVKKFKDMSFIDASEKAHDLLKRHCGFFTFTSILLATPDNIPTGYEIKPVFKETPYCYTGKPLSLDYYGPENGKIILSLPEREPLPFTPDVQLLN